jgi:hypothetical protein
MTIRTKRLPLLPVLTGLVAAAAALSLWGAPTVSAQGQTARYLPEYAANGDLLLPKNFNEWIYLGSPLTPDGLNGGEAGFPEFHNVYIEPGSWRIWRETGVFPEGTILFKELQRVMAPEYPDGSRDEPSGRGFFPGALNGADVSVKDSVRYAETGGWGFFNFNHGEPKLTQAPARSNAECAGCHAANADTDMVFTRFYRLLDR